MPILIPGEVLIEKAKTALGTSYVWGGNSLVGGVDCSGLVQQTFAAFGIELPRVTYEQIGVGASVSRKEMAVGDLVFFDTDSKKQGPDHVGIYMGSGKFIHAPRPGKPVQISSLTDSYYNERLMGVRRVPGVAGAVGGVGAIDPATFAGGGEVVRKSKVELAETYGFNMSFFNSIPELKRLFGQAVKQQWDAPLFQARLKNTKWWKETSDSNRKAQATRKQDPATYKAAIEAARLGISQVAVKMGAVLSNGAVAKLAKNVVHFGWDDAQIQNFLGQYIQFNDKHVLGGMAGAAFDQLRETAYANGVRMSEQSLKDSAAYVVRGVSTMEKEVANIRGLAMGAYPAYADQIEAGQSVRDIAQPYVQAMAKTMEIADSSIDMFNPKVRAAMNRSNSSGQPEPMSLNDFVASLKDSPEWRRTNDARDTMMGVGRQVLADMGLVR